MKLAVIADIHGNLPALQAVTDHLEKWQPDRVVVAGDIVNRGPRPRECWQFVQAKQRTKDWQVVIGNHEEYVIYQSQPDSPRKGPRFQVYATSYWTFRQMRDVSALQALPYQWTQSKPNGLVQVTHASVRGTRDGIVLRTSDDHVRLQINPQAVVFCVGHTHIPLIRWIDQTLVVNVGSVGLPFDGDTRASYAQIEQVDQHWQARIIRLEYNRAQADRDFDETSFMQDSGAFAPLIRSELASARSALMEWSREFEEAVLQGELSIEESVKRFLKARTA